MVSQRTLILECGTDRVSVAVFSCAGPRLCLHQLAVENFPAAVGPRASDEALWFGNVLAAFRGLRTKTKYRGPVVLLLPAHFCLTKFIKVPRVDAGQREKIIRFEAEQNIPYALSDVVWGSIAVSETATETDMLLAATKRDSLDLLCDAADEAGFLLDAVVPAQCATLAGFKLVAGDSGKTFLGLNVGLWDTTLVLVESERFALRHFALAAGDETRAELPEKRASAGQLEPLIARLHQEIARSLLHFKWRTGMSKPGRAWVAGFGGMSAGLVEAVSAKFKIPVETCDWRDVIDCDADCGMGRVWGNASANLIDLTGAAAIRFDHSHASVNLLPPRMLERVSYRGRRPWLLIAALLVMTVLLPLCFHFISLRDEATKKSAAIEHELAPLRARDSRIRKNLSQLAVIQERVAFYEATDGRRDAWIRFLAGMQTHFSEVEDVWLEKLQLVPPAANSPMKLFVSGRMLDRAHPLAKVSPETFSRVNALLNHLATTPFIAAVESEHFDHRLPGVLQFDFVLVTDARQPL